MTVSPESALSGHDNSIGALLSDTERAAFSAIECLDPSYPLLLVCDHASNRIPDSLRQLGLPEGVLQQHVAWDIGAAEVTALLAARLNVPAVFANYSRLVVDCNRPLSHRQAFPDYSDGHVVPGNQNLGEVARQQRVNEIFEPYHHAVASNLKSLQSLGIYPALIAIHSFTPAMDGYKRPWHCGILWDKDPRLAEPMLEKLRALGSFDVGNNQPYSGRHPEDYTLDTHAEVAGLPHVAIELRQDLIAHPEGAAQWAGILATVLKPLLDDQKLFTQYEESVYGS